MNEGDENIYVNDLECPAGEGMKNGKREREREM